MLLPSIIIICIAALVQWFFIKYSLKDMAYKAEISKSIVEPGEHFTIYSEIINYKRLPEIFLEIYEPIPYGADIHGNYNLGKSGRFIIKSFYLLARQKAISRISLSLTSRGQYTLPYVTIYGGDFLGAKSKDKTFPYIGKIVCIPKRIDSPNIIKALGSFLGEVSVRRFIMPDPVLTVGTREYTGREPLKDIHHAHSARQGRLMVRQYDYTLEPAITIILDTRLPIQSTKYNNIETCLSISRVIFEELDKLGAMFAFMTNTKSSFSERWHNVPDGLGSSHINELLGGLGCATYSTTESTISLLNRAIARCEQGRSYIIIMPIESTDNEVHRLLSLLKHISGGLVLLITPEGGEVTW